ncbi:MAG: hypothetical protein M1825_000877 [Sarcosagium campestre]|nr:MAG: hypothetical protein M1825_000877 [Sarcosagium campestre]
MAESRTTRASTKNKNEHFTKELTALLYALGSPLPQAPATIAALDSIVTSFIVSTCLDAAAYAGHQRRAKIKVDDFRWAVRRHGLMLGRIKELLEMDRLLKRERKAFDEKDDRLEELVEAVEDDDELEKGLEKTVG